MSINKAYIYTYFKNKDKYYSYIFGNTKFEY